MGIEWEHLHDSVLEGILIEWEKEAVVISIRTAEHYFLKIKKASIIAEKASFINCPMEKP